ncbi:hypothetical protein [Rubrivirga sp.]|uniref:hypothetical protein n=1 Tax=Rubrivirga sp. TaxID=1885344 RepID=UPI003C740675
MSDPSRRRGVGRRRVWLAAAVAWTFAGTVALMLPGDAVPHGLVSSLDDAAHAILFATGVLLWAFALPRWTWTVGLVAVALAVGSEWAQANLAEDRGAQWSDVGSNVIGIAVALAIAVPANAAWRYANRRRMTSTGRR